jgi:hypothetical protein
VTLVSRVIEVDFVTHSRKMGGGGSERKKGLSVKGKLDGDGGE